MQIVPLYMYRRSDNGITVSPIKPETGGYTLMHRLIADEGRILVKDDEQTYCTDVESTEGWSEIDDPNPIDEQVGG